MFKVKQQWLGHTISPTKALKNRRVPQNNCCDILNKKSNLSFLSWLTYVKRIVKGLIEIQFITQAFITDTNSWHEILI